MALYHVHTSNTYRIQWAVKGRKKKVEGRREWKGGERRGREGKGEEWREVEEVCASEA